MKKIMHSLALAAILLIGVQPLKAENDFWLVGSPGKNPLVRVVQGGAGGNRMVALNEETDETDDQGRHWTVKYWCHFWVNGGYSLDRHLSSLDGHETKNIIKVFDSHEHLRYTLGPTPLQAMMIAKDSARLALGRVSGPDGFQKADYIVFADEFGKPVYKESAKGIEPRIRFSENGDWVAYVAGENLVIRQFSTAKEYRKSLVEVAQRSGSTQVRDFATITDDGVLIYRFYHAGKVAGENLKSDVFKLTYDPKQ